MFQALVNGGKLFYPLLNCFALLLVGFQVMLHEGIGSKLQHWPLLCSLSRLWFHADMLLCLNSN